MIRIATAALSLLLSVAFATGWRFAAQETEIPLSSFEPEHYRYVQAETCVNCHQTEDDIMTRAVGVSLSTRGLQLDARGWLKSVHARSQSHDYRVNTACAWCHAPTIEGATKDTLAAAPIQVGTWEGVTCGACHPGRLDRDMRESLLANLIPGSDPTVPSSYEFVDRSDPQQVNAQCRYCHHEFHEFLSAPKQALHESGTLRCIDCHMAGYRIDESMTVERFHNMKVEDNGPQSCSGEFGTAVGCHPQVTARWMRANIPGIKGPRKEW